jgi:hypothetical protein
MSFRPKKERYVCERIIGFSRPVDGKIAVISYEGIHIIPLSESVEIEHHTDLPECGKNYYEKRQVLVFGSREFSMLGLYGGTPILQNPIRERIQFGDGDFFQVLDSNREEIFRHDFNDLSGDWRHVTFSEDGAFIVLGLPYGLKIFERAT